MYEEFCFDFSSVQYRVCDYCNEKLAKDSRDSIDSPPMIASKKDETDDDDDDVDLRFEVRTERLNQSQTNT